MNIRAVSHLIALQLIVFGLAMAVCAAVSILLHDPLSAQQGLLWAASLTALTGLITRGFIGRPSELSLRDGVGVVTFGWLAASLTGALPYALTGTTPTFLDAFFETVSGLTTTGASILPDPDTVSRGILLWRAMTHFFGGMGILVFCVAIMPMLGTGGMQVYKAETSSLSNDRLTPRITTTAKLMWAIYLLLNGVLFLLLRLGGMDWFDALCHAMATVATGGFSTKTASIAAYNSAYIEVVLIVFMLLGAMNFTLHYQALKGRPLIYFRDTEFRFFMGFWALLCLALTLVNWGDPYPDFLHSLRASFFTGTSILSTTGYCTDDFDRWPGLAKILLVLAMLAGGCAGSTAGGLKHIRLVVMVKRIAREVRLFLHPQAVIQVKLNRRPLENAVAMRIAVYVALYMITFALGTMLLACYLDVETALSTAASMLGSIGPGFSLAGAVETFADFPAPTKIVSVILMLLGRLEFYTLLVVLQPSFWRR